MIPRHSLATLAALAVLAGPSLAQTQAPAATPTAAESPSSVAATPGGQGFTVPPYTCVAPKYPSKESTTQLRAEAYNKAVEAFNKEYKTYAECVKSYVENSKQWVKEIADAGNKAIDEYNKYAAMIKEQVEAEKK
jgi:hypothetical protein